MATTITTNKQQLLPQIPLTWNEIYQIINEKTLEKLVRSETQLNSYNIFRNQIRIEWNSIVDYILTTKFHYPKKKINNCTKNDDGKDLNTNQNKEGDRWISSPPLSDKTETQTCFCLNDHPYYFQDNIEHWILWKINGDIAQEDIDHYKNELKKKSNVIDTLHWINPISLKSIPELDHVHILCLKKA